MLSGFDISSTNRFSFYTKYVVQITLLLKLGIKFNKLNFILDLLLLYLVKYIYRVNNLSKSFKLSSSNT
jgi:hypothetical protein